MCRLINILTTKSVAQVSNSLSLRSKSTYHAARPSRDGYALLAQIAGTCHKKVFLYYYTFLYYRWVIRAISKPSKEYNFHDFKRLELPDLKIERFPDLPCLM